MHEDDPGDLHGVDEATMRRLLLHEARVHAIPGRELRDLGDGLLLFDPNEPEPFWNRLEGVRWPSEPDAFDRRLTEALVLFARSAGSRTSGRRRSTTRRPTSSRGSWRTGSATWAWATSWSSTDPRPAAGRRRRDATGRRSAVERLDGVGRRRRRTRRSTDRRVLCDAFDVEEARAAGRRAGDRAPRSRTVLHPLPGPPRRRARGGRAAGDVRRR